MGPSHSGVGCESGVRAVRWRANGSRPRFRTAAFVARPHESRRAVRRCPGYELVLLLLKKPIGGTDETKGGVERLIYLPPVSVGRLGKGDETIRVTVARVRGGRFRRRPRFVTGPFLMWPTLWRFEKPVPLRVRALSNPTFAIKAEVCSSYLAKIPLDGNNVRRARSTPVDPAGGHRYGGSLKPRESRGARPRRTRQ